MLSCFRAKGVCKIPERNIAIRVDEDLFKKIKIRTLEKGMTLREYFIDLAKKDIRDSELDKMAGYNKEEVVEKADRIIQLMQEIKESQKN